MFDYLKKTNDIQRKGIFLVSSAVLGILICCLWFVLLNRSLQQNDIEADLGQWKSKAIPQEVKSRDVIGTIKRGAQELLKEVRGFWQEIEVATSTDLSSLMLPKTEIDEFQSAKLKPVRLP